MVVLGSESSVATLSLPLGESWWPYFEYMGVYHPDVSHFPIALLTVAGLVEAWSVFRRERKPANATLVCLTIGTLAAVVATVLGWADADRTGDKGDTLDLHRWLGVAVAVLSVVALVLSLIVHRGNAKGAVVWTYRANVFVTAALVGLVGSLGGKLVHGEDYYDDALAELVEATSKKVADVAETAAEEGVDVARDAVKGAADAVKTVPGSVQAVVSAAATDGPAAAPATPSEAVAGTQPTTGPTTGPTTVASGTPVIGPALGGGRVDYARDILPIFEAECTKCHNDKKTKGDYRMDTVKHLFAAGETGEAPIVPGKSYDSLLVKLIEGKGEYEDLIMPPKGDPLTPQQIALIRRWIDEGAQPGVAQP